MAILPSSLIMRRLQNEHGLAEAEARRGAAVMLALGLGKQVAMTARHGEHTLLGTYNGMKLQMVQALKEDIAGSQASDEKANGSLHPLDFKYRCEQLEGQIAEDDPRLSNKIVRDYAKRIVRDYAKRALSESLSAYGGLPLKRFRPRIFTKKTIEPLIENGLVERSGEIHEIGGIPVKAGNAGVSIKIRSILPVPLVRLTSKGKQMLAQVETMRK